MRLSLRTQRFVHPLGLLVLPYYVTKQTEEPPLHRQPTVQSCSSCGGGLLQGSGAPSLSPVASHCQDTAPTMLIKAFNQATTSLSLLQRRLSCKIVCSIICKWNPCPDYRFGFHVSCSLDSRPQLCCSMYQCLSTGIPSSFSFESSISS